MHWLDGTGRFAYHLNQFDLTKHLRSIRLAWHWDLKLCPARTWLKARFFFGKARFSLEVKMVDVSCQQYLEMTRART